MQNVHMFMLSEPFDAPHTEMSCVDPNIVKPTSIFIGNSVANTKVASRVNKLNFVVNALNKAKERKTKSQQIVCRQAEEQEQ